jgi:NADH-quinone oxidoreductase subunit E
MSEKKEPKEIEILEVVQKQPSKTHTVLSSLLAIHNEYHYISDNSIKVVATYTKKTINDVYGVASFYTNFRFTPPGEVTLDVCWGPSCHLLGSQNLLKEVHGLLGIKGEGETNDGKLTLRYSTCLGACAQGPVFAIDHKLFGKGTIEKIKNEISGI